MSVFYIERDFPKTIFALDSTSRSSLKTSGKATSYPIEDGSSVQDNYVNENNVVEFQGKISTVKSLSSSINLTPEKYIEGLLEMKDAREVFTIYWSASSPEMSNCVFTSLEFSHDKTSGLVGGHSSVSVSFSVKQLRIAQKAEVSVRPATSFVDKTSTEAKGDAGNKDGKTLKKRLQELHDESGANFIGGLKSVT